MCPELLVFIVISSDTSMSSSPTSVPSRATMIEAPVSNWTRSVAAIQVVLRSSSGVHPVPVSGAWSSITVSTETVKKSWAMVAMLLRDPQVFPLGRAVLLLDRLIQPGVRIGRIGELADRKHAFPAFRELGVELCMRQRSQLRHAV